MARIRDRGKWAQRFKEAVLFCRVVHVPTHQLTRIFKYQCWEKNRNMGSLWL